MFRLPTHTQKALLGAILATLALSAAAISNTKTPTAKSSIDTGFSRPVSRNIHALIMAIGNYPAPIPTLPGVSHDIDSAKSIARRMGVSNENISVLRDGELTLSGMKKAFEDLQKRIQPNDQVFIYYSGHGGRSLALEETPPDRCAESLITYDGYGFRDALLEGYLNRLSAKAQKIVVFIDACHSGGVTTRGRTSLARGLTSKYWDNLGEKAATCSQPSNVVTRGIVESTKTRGFGGGNFIYIAASRADELSFDEATNGGIATQSWLACLSGAAKDKDNSGGLTAEEIRICAQNKVDRKLASNKGITPSHVVLTGNQDMVLSYSPQHESAGSEIKAPARPVKATSQAEPSAPLATNALKDIFSNRDDRRLVTLQAERTHLRIGKDLAAFTIVSREPGFLYLLMAGSDGKTFELIYPNAIDGNNKISAGQTVRLPSSNWQLTPQGPAGKSTLLAVVSDLPTDFAQSGFRTAGIFSNANASAARDIQLLTITPNSSCITVAKKKPSDAPSTNCSGSYGAATIEIDEVGP